MAAYYNEIDPFASEWLKNLINAGLIADGEVDTRSIIDVSPEDVRGFNQCHFFAGIGVWSLALRNAGFDDKRKVWTGSCPCQPFSSAGKGKGIDDARHLWPHFHRLITECSPPIVFGEQVASYAGLGWLDIVQADLEASGYAAAAADLCAAGIGAPHIRQRLYWFAKKGLGNPNDQGLQGHGKPREIQVQERWQGTQGHASSASMANPWKERNWVECGDGCLRCIEPGTCTLAPRTSNHVGRLRAYGNAIVEPLARKFIQACIGD